MVGVFEASRVQRRSIVTPVVLQHLEDAAVLHATRCLHVWAPHVKLNHLRRTDDRLAAHLHGLSVAGDAAWPLCEAELEPPTPGRVFDVAALALERIDTDRLERLYALTQAVPASRPGLFAAFGWSEPAQLRGIVAKLLASGSAFHRLVGIAASAMHRVDPGIAAARRMEDSNPAARARALRTAGEVGLRNLVSTVAKFIADDDPHCRFWAARSAVLLGDRKRAPDYLAEVAVDPGDVEGKLVAHALQISLQASDVATGMAVLRRLPRITPSSPAVIRGSGIVGDPAFVPWLIGQMGNEATARVAGEAFSLITGTDLAWLDLERKPPENFESGPNDDPNDPNVEMDQDDSLPWPDQKLIQAWWNANSHRFQPGVRYFMGEPLNRENCLRVLKAGYQRQRIAAAIYLSLLNPGTPLFEWRAPAWRQQRLLATMT
jgi:uncharacterized protein (TIGR02270 family)